MVRYQILPREGRPAACPKPVRDYKAGYVRKM
jgi:hypothetical protein